MKWKLVRIVRTIRRMALPLQQPDAPQPVFAAGGIVYRVTAEQEVEILLIKKRGGYWSLPKGRLKPGETSEAAACREIYEETGIKGRIEAQVRQVNYTVVVKQRRQRKVVTYYLLQATAGTPRPHSREQIIKVRWFPLDVALQRLQRKRLRKVVKRVRLLLRADAPLPPPASSMPV